MLTTILLGYLLAFTAMTGVYARSVRVRQEAEEAIVRVCLASAEISY